MGPRKTADAIDAHRRKLRTENTKEEWSFARWHELLNHRDDSDEDFVAFMKYDHSNSTKRIWDVGDEYTVCTSCGKQTGWPGNEYGMGACDSLRLALLAERLFQK